MVYSDFNGLTLQQLNAQIMKSTIGFSVEENCIKYLGRQLQLDGETILLSETNQDHTESKRLLDRLAALQPELRAQLTWSTSDCEALQKFRMIKASFQCVSDDFSFANDDSPMDCKLMQIDSEQTLASGLQLMRKIIGSVGHELAIKLMPKVENIEKEFSRRIEYHDKFRALDQFRFKRVGNNLLYLVAACSGYSEQADIAELTSFLSSAFNRNSELNFNLDMRHVAKELAFLAKQPGSVSYSHYVAVAAQVLKTPSFNPAKYREIPQLSDPCGFSLLENNTTLTPYLTALRELVNTVTPNYSSVLAAEIEQIAGKFCKIPPRIDRPAIKERVHRLLLVTAACSGPESTMTAAALAPFVTAIMKHNNKKNLIYLISGLAWLVQSTVQTQHLLCQPDLKGGDHLRLAPLGLVRFLPAMISWDDLQAICKHLQASTAGRRKMKNGRVFHRWLVTLNLVRTNPDPNQTRTGQVLQALTLNMSLIYEKLVLLELLIKAARTSEDTLQIIGCMFNKDEVMLRIAEKGAKSLIQHNQPTRRWLLQQRHSHLLPLYHLKIMAMERYGKAELITLIHQFVEACESNQFVASRQSASNNQHLQAVYRSRPELAAGWGANFTGFSPALREQVDTGETLELTEDPWDLFISGFEVNTCQSPDGEPILNSALMGYVMDGRNAMIVRKDSNGHILARAIIRVILNNNDCPVLFIERTYSKTYSKFVADIRLFTDAAREIAQQMRLDLYHKASDKEPSEPLKILTGRAPYDYFDSAGFVAPTSATYRANIAIKGAKLNATGQ